MFKDLIKGIVFDVDGVIADTASFHYESWKKAVAPLGLDLTLEKNAGLKGLPRRDTLIAILKIFGKEDSLSEEQIAKMCVEKNDDYVHMLKTRLTPEDILPGIREFISAARSAGLKIAAASTSHSAPIVLSRLGVIDSFDYIVDPALVKRGKPDPEIFLAACKGIGISPAEAIGIEDAMPGVVGLKAAGLFTIAITHGDPGDWSKADLSLKSTSDLDLGSVLRLAARVIRA